MKTIGVVVNTEKDKGLQYTKVLVETILSKGGNVLTTSGISRELEIKLASMTEEEVYHNAEVLICLGGDGTFLQTARKAQMGNKPILGINLGSLGFLTEVEKSEIQRTVDQILSDHFEIENRMILEGIIYRDGAVLARDVALNDIVISRGALSRILHLKTYINQEFVDSFPGDGLIISTPTGSTAYSMSAGGPIVEPDMDLILVTPICPHILYSRSIITAGNRLVRIKVDENYGHNAMVTVDGQMGYEITGGDYIEIKKAEKSVRMIRMNKKNFFNILRTKIYDRGEDLKKDEI